MLTPSLIIVLITVVINMMGVGLSWPILPALVRELSGGTVSETAAIYGLMAVIYALMQFTFAPLLGGLSDRFGRKPVMLIALTALGLDNILLAWAPSIEWVFFGRLVGGILASSMAIANAYVTDVTTKEDRAAGFGLIGAAFGLGFIIGPVAGGILGEIDLRLPFYCAAALSLLNVAFGIVMLRETLPKEKRSKKSLALSNPLSSVSWLAKNNILLMLGFALFFATTMERGLESIWVLFTQERYGWGMKEAGSSLALVGICFVFVQGFLVARVVKRFGEMKVLVFGMSLSASLYLFLSFNTVGIISFWGIVPHIIGWGCATPALQALASHQIDESEQGYLQGALSGVTGLSAIIGPAISTAMFSYFTSESAPIYFPGAFFLFGAIFLLLAAAFGSRAKIPAQENEHKNDA
ncbi:MAG: TCR/Tet family MFS transporter [Rhizobiaceae bacterium]|nr:TCR/Tet family MFS transporter [Rhizobiaceae bacterium]